MNISAYSVKNYQFTLVVFLAAMALGIYSLFNMPKGEDPDFDAPTFVTVAVYPGTSAMDMEKLIVKPLENRYNQFDNLRRVITNISDGIAIIIVEYKFEENVNDKYQEIVRETNAARSELPSDIYALQIEKLTASDVNIYQYALVSENMPYTQLKKHGEELEAAIEKVKQIRKAEVVGLPKENVKIHLNIQKLAQYKIPVTRVIGAIQSENINIPGGSIAIETKKFNIKTDGDFKSLDEIRNTIIGSSGTKIVYLRDVATVDFGYEDQTYIARYNGHRAVFVNASQKAKQNIFATKKQVEQIVADYKQNLPKNVDLVKVFDQGESVQKRLTGFAGDFAIAIVLVLFTLLPLGFRASIVVMISIPLSLAMGLTMLDFLGFSLNQLSIVGMIIALGILVDDSIVVVENIERYLRMGYTRKKAAIAATKQITLAVVGCTATLIVAFFPLLFLPDGSGQFIKSLPMAVVTTIFASMVISLTIVPFLSSRILKEHHDEKGNIFLQYLQKGISASYSKVLERALQAPWTTILVATLIFGGALMVWRNMGFSLFPKSEKPMFLVDIEMPEGTNIQTANRIAQQVEDSLAKKPLIKSYSTNVGKGNPRIYYNILQRQESENFAQIFVQLQPDTDTETKVAFIDELRAQFTHIPNTEIMVRDFEQGPPVEAPLVYRIFGENLDTLRKIAFDVEKIITATEGTIYINNPLSVMPTDLKVKINKDKAGMLGIPTADIDRTVRLGVAGINVGKYREDDGDEFNINVSVPNDGSRKNLDIFNQMYVNNLTGLSFPLRQVVDVEMETSPTSIRHYLFDRYVAVSAYNKTGYLTEALNTAIEEKLSQYPFPKGYSFTAAGEKESKQKSFGGLGLTILITIFAFISILILEFKTFKSTIIVLSVIPLGMIGAILMLYFNNLPFSFTAVIGLIALVGIEVKNSILLVDFTNQLREQGKSVEEAVREAGEIRFVPIVLTSLTAIGGLLPLAIKFNPLYSPLALVLIGGLISSTLLSRLVTPVMYKLLPPKIKENEDK
jgi:multidrug efflux pump subunit AcrB